MQEYSPSPTEEVIDISSERNLGLVGSLLALAAFIPKIGGIISLLSPILILISLNGIGNKLGDEGPFKDYLKGFIIGLVLGFIGGALIISAALISFQSPEQFPMHFTYDEGHGGLTDKGEALILSGLIIVLLAIILAAYFEKKAWMGMYRITGVKEFENTAKFLWWGVLTLVILVGVILLLVAWVYQIIAFSNLPRQIRKKSPSLEESFEEVVW